MHESDRCGMVSGTEEELARIFSCTVSEVHSAVSELATSGAATVTLRNEVVTLVNRRMHREYKARKASALRQQRHRGPPGCHGESDGSVTPKSQPNTSVSVANSKKKKGAGGKAADPRHQALVDYFSEIFKGVRGYAFIATPADYKELDRMLKRVGDRFTLEDLMAAVKRFLHSEDKFYLKMGKPLAYWAGNINAFLQAAAAAAEIKGEECDRCLGTGRRLLIYDTRRPEEVFGCCAWSELGAESFNLKPMMAYVCRCECPAGEQHPDLKTVDNQREEHDRKAIPST